MKSSAAMHSSFIRTSHHVLSAVLAVWMFSLFLAEAGPGLSNMTPNLTGEGNLGSLSSDNIGVSSYKSWKLLDAVVHSDRIGESCSKEDIVVYQGATTPLPNGIPTYTVQILNVCVTGCSIGHIHLNCGWFSSARMINPKIFKRLKYNDCLVNGGMALKAGGSVSFEYANTYQYPLSVAAVTCS